MKNETFKEIIKEQLLRLDRLIAINDIKIKEKQNQNIFLKNHWT
jgi:hypothetical protein